MQSVGVRSGSSIAVESEEEYNGVHINITTAVRRAAVDQFVFSVA